MDVVATREPIMAAGLLDKLADMLFKGIGNALSEAAEFEEEMGVLKQINRIPIHGSDGKDYTLTIKLSPIRNKDSYYYIEAETDAPGLNVSLLDKKTMKIDKTSIADFNKKIDNFLRNAGYPGDLPDIDNIDSNADQESEENAADDTDADSDDEELNNNDNTLTLEGAVVDLIDKTEDYYNSENYGAWAGDTIVKLRMQFIDIDDFKNCKLLIEGTMKDEAVVPEDEFTLSALDSEGNVKDFESFKDEVLMCIQDYARNNGLQMPKAKIGTNASINFQASFIRENAESEVELVSLHASTDYQAAMNVIYDIIDDPSFVSNLDDNTEKCFDISDNGDNYDINLIDSIDNTEDYLRIFKDISIVDSALRTYRWAVGENAWCSDTFFFDCRDAIHELIEAAVIWVLTYTDKYPNVIGTFGNDCTDLANLTVDGELDLNLVKQSVIDLISGLADELDIYYVNFDHSGQAVIDDFINKVDKLLAYS